MHEVKNRPLIDTIYQDLREEILQEKRKKGEKLSENTLAEQYRCSRTPVREALKRLEQDGFIVILPHSGSYVKDSTVTDYRQLTEVRTYLEALAIRLDCEGDADTAELVALLDEMDAVAACRTIDVPLFNSLHYRFHRTLVHLAGNPLLEQLWSRLNLNESALMFDQVLNKSGMKKTQAEHRHLVQAIEDRNARDGERFMVSHLWKKRERIKAEDPKA
jgi:DNA-binding GntR family transcriptional regulator